MADTDEFLIYVKWAESLYLPQGKQTVPLEVTHSTPLTEVKSQALRLFGHPEKPGGGYDLEGLINVRRNLRQRSSAAR